MAHTTTQIQAFATGRSIAGAPYIVQPVLEVALETQIAVNDAVIAQNKAVLSEYDILSAAADEAEWKGFNAYMRCMQDDGIRAQDLDEEMGRYESTHPYAW